MHIPAPFSRWCCFRGLLMRPIYFRFASYLPVLGESSEETLSHSFIHSFILDGAMHTIVSSRMSAKIVWSIGSITSCLSSWTGCWHPTCKRLLHHHLADLPVANESDREIVAKPASLKGRRDFGESSQIRRVQSHRWKEATRLLSRCPRQSWR